MADVPALKRAVRGVSENGVPYVALPTEATTEARGLLILWHGADPPRTEEALAGALPLARVPVWRLYLGMPGHGRRAPAGGLEEMMRLGYEDAVTLLFEPRIEGAVAELRGAVDDIRSKLGIGLELPLGIFGFSQGGAAALLAVERRIFPFRAAATYGAVTDMHALVDGLASFFGTSYEWTDPRARLADQMSVGKRPGELAAAGVPILLAVGANDQLAIEGPSERLVAEVSAAGGNIELSIIPQLAHAFVDEPGEESAPQGAAAREIDRVVSDWFLPFFA